MSKSIYLRYINNKGILMNFFVGLAVVSQQSF